MAIPRETVEQILQTARIEEVVDMIVYELYFEEHMKEQKVDVVADLERFEWNTQQGIEIQTKNFYEWLLQSQNMVRQKIMLLDTRSSNILYPIHKS